MIFSFALKRLAPIATILNAANVVSASPEPSTCAAICNVHLLPQIKQVAQHGKKGGRKDGKRDQQRGRIYFPDRK